MELRRCHHVKVNGTQCGSPALRGKCYCYFHHNYRHLGTYGAPQRPSRDPFHGRFPVLEDANSVQAAIMQVIRLMLARQIDPKEAGLLLYALQLASCNLRDLQLRPLRDEIVVDPLLVNHSTLGGNPVRHEHLTAESDEEQKTLSQREEQLQKSQQQAEAQWEQETRREFEAIPETEDGARGAVTSPPRFVTPTPEQVRKLQQAVHDMYDHPDDVELARAYAETWENLGDPAEDARET